MAQPASRTETSVIGAAAALGGLYLMLVGTGLLPVPGGPENLHAPLWVVLCAGLAFFLAGVVVAAQSFGKADADGDLPADAPAWLPIIIHVIGVAIFACFAAMGSWVAFGGGPRQFSGSIAGVSGAADEGIGRIAFGIGAIIAWLSTIAFAWIGLERLRRRPPPPGPGPGA
jgi:hypothetical protein